MTGLQVFQILKARIDEREAEAFVSYVDENRRQMLEDCRGIFATKEDLALLRNELKGDISTVRTELANVRGNLEVKISDVRTDVMRWMFAFFITTLLAILGLYFKK
ncbi:MAG TPA: hypothetical protein VGS79_13665 [Puia sp.]|nr:hypothetical protein [Puia sp.]